MRSYQPDTSAPTMRLRVMLASWGAQTDVDHLIEALHVVRAKHGNVPVFFDGRAAEPIDDSEFGPPPREIPKDVGLGVVLEVPMWPTMGEYLQFKKREVPMPESIAGFEREDAFPAARRVEAAKLLGVDPPAEDAAMVAKLAEFDAWSEATYRNWWLRVRDYETALESYRNQVLHDLFDLCWEVRATLDKVPRETWPYEWDDDTYQDDVILRLGILLRTKPRD